MPIADLSNLSLSLGRLFKTWSLTRIEPATEMEAINGQFWAENVREEGGTQYAEIAAPQSTSPVQQYIRVEGDRLSATLAFVAEVLGSSWKPIIQKLDDWRRPHDQLGRPPILTFTCGETYFSGFLTSVSKARTHPMLDGRWHMTTVDIQMIAADADDSRYRDIVLDPTRPASKSRFKPMPDSATYELLAEREYGHAIVGVFLRQDHIDAFPEAGQLVLMSEKSNFINRHIAPDAYMLSDHPKAVEARQALFDQRGGKVRVPGA